MATVTNVGDSPANVIPAKADSNIAEPDALKAWKNAGIWSHWPFKGLYFLYAIFSLVFWFPFWCIVYLPRKTRPRKSWTLKETVLVMTEHRLQWLISRTRTPMPVKNPNKLPKASKLKDCHVEWIKAVDPSKLKGFLQSTYARSAKVPVYIYPQKTMEEISNTDDGLVALFFHGGGYFLLSAAPNFTPAAISRNLVKMPGVTAVLAVEYRLSCFTPAPGCLIDCFSSWVNAVDVLKIDPKRIVLVGDSAGGALVMALLRYLRDETEYEMPRACMVLSPSCDAASWDEDSVAQARKRTGPQITDYLNRRAMSPLYRAALAGNRPDKEEKILFENPYMSPANLKYKYSTDIFEGFPKTLIAWGSAEVLAEEISRVRDSLKQCRVDTTSYEIEDGIHDSLTVSWWNQESKDKFWQKIATPWFKSLDSPNGTMPLQKVSSAVQETSPSATEQKTTPITAQIEHGAQQH